MQIYTSQAYFAQHPFQQVIVKAKRTNFQARFCFHRRNVISYFKNSRYWNYPRIIKSWNF